MANVKHLDSSNHKVILARKDQTRVKKPTSRNYTSARTKDYSQDKFIVLKMAFDDLPTIGISEREPRFIVLDSKHVEFR